VTERSVSPTGRIQRVAAYNVCVDENGRLLLCRLSDVTEAPGSWTLPGGGIEFGEHPEAGAIRELQEETGLLGRIVELLTVDSLHRPARAGENETNESTDRAAWYTREELATLPLVSTSELGVRLAFGDPA